MTTLLAGPSAAIPGAMTDLSEQIRSFWDVDAATYDNSSSHDPRSPLVRAAWAAAIRRLLPPPPARVLDAGAGTGFLSLLAAEQGHRVTSVDLSPQMLSRLRDKAAERRLDVETVETDATHPPRGPFDAVIERHLVWTLPDPAAAVEAWRQAAPTGTLVLFESQWGAGGGLPGRIRSSAQEALRRSRRQAPDHHGEYSPALRSRLPLGSGTAPEALLALVAASSWGTPRIERLRDIDWATRQALPRVLDRAIGVTSRFAVIAGT